MEECDLSCLEAGATEDVIEILKKFIERHTQTYTFDDLRESGRHRKLWTSLFHRLQNEGEAHCYKYCLSCVRILSRDKTELNEMICEEWLQTLLHHAGLISQDATVTSDDKSHVNYEVMSEAMKCLCNIIFNSPCAQMLSTKNHSLEGIVVRLQACKNPDVPHDVKFFTMKMLFLITALGEEVTPQLKSELVMYLTDTLDLILKEAGGAADDEKRTVSSDMKITVSDDQVALACEVLKVLFNLTVKSGEYEEEGKEEEGDQFVRLASILHDLLLSEPRSREKQYELHRHIVNLLMNTPHNSFEKLMPPVQRYPQDPAKEFEYDGRNMEAVAKLLDFLDYRLDLTEENMRSQYDLLCPILCLLVKCVCRHRSARKFLRQKVLPPLTDVHSRPEEGSSLRNKLCRLLTTPVAQVRNLVESLLFVLCKENVIRMVKYTGYGNAAGFLAKRGALLGGGGNSDLSSMAQYSSDSEDSDTEEYKKLKPQINIMTGCYEKPHPDPMASMSEEQKEYEALELVKKLDRLARDGIVQPGVIGEDGRPKPMGQVLELIEDLSRQQVKPPQDED